jgi:hypothetical protein
MQFVPHQLLQPVLRSEASNKLFSMLRYALGEIRRHADVERSSWLIGHNVNAKLLCHLNGFPLSRE